MSLKMLERMNGRLEVSKDISDAEYFLSLLYYFELLLKVTVSGVLAAIVDGKERSRYTVKYGVLRSDGIGGWIQALDEILLGPISAKLLIEARGVQQEITKKCGSDEWQYIAAVEVNKAACSLGLNEKIGSRSSLRQCFSEFVYIRNKTRGHGAPPSDICTGICSNLKSAIDVIVKNFLLFRLEWGYLKQNLSGKYRVIKVSDSTEKLDELKKAPNKKISYSDGLYIYYDKPRPVEIITTDSDLADYYFPNGSFNGKTYELISYVSGRIQKSDASAYLLPADQLPPSETKGLTGLDVQGESLGNLPCTPDKYITRSALEAEVKSVLLDSRHPVVTLVGRGGIGKTSTALKVLHELAQSKAFDLFLWFSARDIDLRPDGVKIVKPEVLTLEEIAEEYIRLVDPDEQHLKPFNGLQYFKDELQGSSSNGKIIYIFDNFETVKDPLDLFVWLNTNIRLPNKILITTRHRDFKGDYPIEVGGMEEAEAVKLIKTYSAELGIPHLVGQAYIEELLRESDGHPYIIKVLLGEVAKAKEAISVKRILASKDQMLEALFERTYAGLSAAAKRLFLTLSNWRSTVPLIAVESVMLTSKEGDVDFVSAFDELVSSSFIERNYSKVDDVLFVTVPLTASVFGRKKLLVSPYKLIVESDTELLLMLGASQNADIRYGVMPRILYLASSIKNSVTKKGESLDRYLTILEYISRRYNPGWLVVADLLISLGLNHDLAKEYIRNFIQNSSDKTDSIRAWKKHMRLCRETDDYNNEIISLLELCKLDNLYFETLSDCANRINQLFSEKRLSIESEEKRILVNSVIEMMESRLNEASAVDCSRLAWLYINNKDQRNAFRICSVGLELDPYEVHCFRLHQKLNTEFAVASKPKP